MTTFVQAMGCTGTTAAKNLISQILDDNERASLAWRSLCENFDNGLRGRFSIDTIAPDCLEWIEIAVNGLDISDDQSWKVNAPGVSLLGALCGLLGMRYGILYQSWERATLWALFATDVVQPESMGTLAGVIESQLIERRKAIREHDVPERCMIAMIQIARLAATRWTLGRALATLSSANGHFIHDVESPRLLTAMFDRLTAPIDLSCY